MIWLTPHNSSVSFVRTTSIRYLLLRWTGPCQSVDGFVIESVLYQKSQDGPTRNCIDIQKRSMIACPPVACYCFCCVRETAFACFHFVILDVASTGQFGLTGRIWWCQIRGVGGFERIDMLWHEAMKASIPNLRCGSHEDFAMHQTPVDWRLSLLLLVWLLRMLILADKRN